MNYGVLKKECDFMSKLSMKNSPKRKSNLGLTALTLTALTIGLAGCGTTTPVNANDTLHAQSSYALTIKIQKDANRTDLEQRLGGRVVMWHPEAGFAILGMNEGAASRLRASRSSSAANLELNHNRLSATGSLGAWTGGSLGAWTGGSLGAWTGGSLGAWTGGSLGAWTGGTYNPAPENSATWQQIHLQQAQTRASNLGATVKVAVIDTGIDLNHPAFNNALVSAGDMYDYVDGDAVPQEQGVDGQNGYGHGTSVSGIVLQVAPEAKVMPLRALDADGYGDITAVASAIDFAVAHGAKVINLSLGALEHSPSLSTSIGYATSQGVMVVSSSGNTGDTSMTYPAMESNSADTSGNLSLSVGSVDANDHKSGFSTYGANLEVLAPGEYVYGPVPNNRRGAWSGTSMAAPMVSGGLALALGQTLSVAPNTLAQALKTSAQNINGLNPNYVGQLGAGRINLESFLNNVTTP
jgi:thermitase